LIGRASNCDICLPNHPEFYTVSRQHCIVKIGLDDVQVRDCGSHNGTFLNGMQIGRPVDWHCPKEIVALPCRDYDVVNGDELRVGDTVYGVGVSRTADVPCSSVPPTVHQNQPFLVA
jgi:pSer/pThr/pTyr-binding forkhead associated (FHA) protein